MLEYLRQVYSKFRLFLSKSQPTTCRSTMDELMKPPQKVRGKTLLDKHDFDMEIEIPIITANRNKISEILPHIKKYCLKLKNLKPVQNTNENNVDIYLNPDLVKDFSSFTLDVQNLLQSHTLNDKCIKPKKIMLGYEHFSLESIFRAVLPLDKEGMSESSYISV